MHVKVINSEAVQYPYTTKQVRLDNPKVSFSRAFRLVGDMPEYNAYQVTLIDAPAYDTATQKLIENMPVYNVDHWEQSWSVVDKTQAELDAEQQIIDDRDDEIAIKANSALKALLTARPAQIETYIDNNVTDLASARTVLKHLAKAVSILGRQLLRD